MGKISKSTKKMLLWLTSRGALIDNGSLTSSRWYSIASRGVASAFPAGFVVDSVFKTSNTSTFTLSAGDSVYPIVGHDDAPLSRDNVFCKTDAEITMEEGTIDVTDSCANGHNSMILDGYVNISGSFPGFLKFDPETGELDSQTEKILSRFVDTATDDGEDAYSYTPRENERILVSFLLNSDAQTVGNIQNWLMMWVLITSANTGGALKEAQKRECSWTKADGPVALYKRTVTAGDTF